MKKLLLLALLPALGGCAFMNSFISNANTKANLYLPIIGKDIIMVANILVQAECSPALSSASLVTGNVLNIIAPNSKAAATVQNILATNQAVAQQLCPFAQAVRTSIGSVPAVIPSQIVN